VLANPRKTRVPEHTPFSSANAGSGRRVLDGHAGLGESGHRVERVDPHPLADHGSGVTVTISNAHGPRWCRHVASVRAPCARRLRRDDSLGGVLEQVALTSLSHGAGCGCKLPAADLLPIVRGLGTALDPRLLVGSASGDDAAVFQLRPDLALVQTVDFFTPIVDDPYDFGRIAAANALSDVYAMGGSPVTALNLVAFPLERLGGEILRRILEGGLAVAEAAGCLIVGGHSIDDPEPKYGLAVTGTVDPAAMLTNSAARSGDVLVLTKPLGVGAIATAHKRGAAEPAQLAEAVAVMVALNADASRQAVAASARAATDVTGFGLLGHLHGLGRESGLAAEVRAKDVPALPGALELLEEDVGVSGGGRRNRDYADSFTSFAAGVTEARRRLVCDPVTSGGLLVALPAARAADLEGAMIGRMVDGEPGAISVV
jgi:selenide,water dikinase